MKCVGHRDASHFELDSLSTIANVSNLNIFDQQICELKSNSKVKYFCQISTIILLKGNSENPSTSGQEFKNIQIKVVLTI